MSHYVGGIRLTEDRFGTVLRVLRAAPQRSTLGTGQAAKGVDHN